MRILTKPEPDPGGKVVDVYGPVEYLRTLVFDYREGLERDLVRLSLSALLRISGASSKRVRERDLPIRLGEYTNRLGMHLLIIGLPYELHTPAFRILSAELSSHEAFAEVNYSSTTDFNPKPFVRYDHGKFIWYADKFIKIEDVTPPQVPGVSFEIRSCELRSKPAKNPYSAPDPPQRKASSRHSERDWLENRASILNFVESFKGPCGYKRLAKIIRDYFGISVFEENSPEFGEYGLIRLSSNTDNEPPAVRMLVRGDLDERLKYVVLAHELAHYVLHFQILTLSQIVEQVSWSIPEVELYYLDLIDSGDPSLLQTIEDEADDLASLFLIPPWLHPVDRVAQVILEGDRSPSPEEMIWRCLQPLFPEDRFAAAAWKDLDEIRWRTLRDSLRGDLKIEGRTESLFHRAFRAALRVERTGLEEIGKRRQTDVIFDEMQKVLTVVAEREDADARSYIKKLLAERGPTESGDFRSDFLWTKKSFCRELIPPIEWNGVDAYPRVPLEPAIYNRDGLPEGDWRIKTHRNKSPAGTLREWGELKRDYGLMIYRLESWQKEYLARL